MRLLLLQTTSYDSIHIFSILKRKTNATAIQALPKVTIHYFAADELQALSALADKTMNLTVTITEALAYVSSADANVAVTLRTMESL